MQANKKILVVQQFRSPGTEQLLRDLEHHGVSVSRVSADHLAAQVVANAPDYVMVDKFGFGDIDAQARYDQLIAATTPVDTPLAELVDAIDQSANSAALQFTPPFQPDHVLLRLSNMSRLKSIQAEMARRAETARSLGLLDASTVPSLDHVPTLLLVSWGDRFAAIRSNLAPHFNVVGAVSASAALDHLKAQPVSGVLIDTIACTTCTSRCVASIRTNKRLHGLPIALIVPPGNSSRDLLAANYAIDDVYADPVNDTTAVSLLADVVEYQHYRAWSASARSTEHTGDHRLPLFSSTFFNAHVDRLISPDPQDQSCHVRADIQLRCSAGNIEDMVRPVARLIAMVSRGEDLASYLGNGRFGLIMASTTMEHAVIALQRIVAVIENTQFGPIPLEVDSSVTPLT